MTKNCQSQFRPTPLNPTATALANIPRVRKKAKPRRRKPKAQTSRKPSGLLSKRPPNPEAQTLASARHGKPEQSPGAASAAASALGKRARGKRKNFSPEERLKRATRMRLFIIPLRHAKKKAAETNPPETTES